SSASMRFATIIFACLLLISAFKYGHEFSQRRSNIPLEGGPFGEFEISATFPDTSSATVDKVEISDEMVIRGWTIAKVIDKKGGSDESLHLRLRVPNWMKYYLDPAPGTEIVFQSDGYSLQGIISTDF
ncbi:MAG: hypothetical protein JW941_06370, partial [Candidatus Coatesbacteria bacterium]|nr:hypothetical protein [Candidatus Coatesbacteria bacterium]